MKRSTLSKTVLCSCAAFFVFAANLIVTSGSIVLWGEPKCPKDLLK